MVTVAKENVRRICPAAVSRCDTGIFQKYPVKVADGGESADLGYLHQRVIAVDDQLSRPADADHVVAIQNGLPGVLLKGGAEVAFVVSHGGGQIVQRQILTIVGFQMVDDLLDVEGDAATLGKTFNKPEIKVENYKGISAPKASVAVTEEDVDAELKPFIMRATPVVSVDREAKLHRRIESDYSLIDLAHAVLYGSESLDDGLAALAPPWWADALALHYCDLMTWAEVGATLGYTEQHAWRCAQAAFEVLDAHGLTASVAGRGFAQDD